MVFRLLEFVISAPAFLWNTTTKKKRVAPGRVKNTKTVAIVGGNFAGLAALRELQSCWKKKSRYCYDNDSDETETTALRIVLIDKRGYSEYTPGILRLFCDSGHLFHLAQALPETTSGDGNDDGDNGCCSLERIQGTVTSIVVEDPASSSLVPPRHTPAPHQRHQYRELEEQLKLS